MPIFNGENYEYWSLQMKTLFISQDLWDLVEDGYKELEKNSTGKATPESQQALKENKKRDAKALFLIQQGISKNLFPRLLSATTSKNAWEILKIEFQGSQKVISIKLQSLWREFDNLLMKENESIQVFFTKVFGIVNQIRSYGDTILDKKIVEKTLRSLPPKFDHVVAAIEESKDLAAFSLHELIGSLEAHEKGLIGLQTTPWSKLFNPSWIRRRKKTNKKENLKSPKTEKVKENLIGGRITTKATITTTISKDVAIKTTRMVTLSLNVVFVRRLGTKVQIVGIGVPDAEYPTILKEIADIRKIMKPISQKIMTLQSNFIHVSALVKNHKIYGTWIADAVTT
ncbi:unnamed protein product [Prunus armeniaca]|uniref:Uncharacterized protein n=1 Tax=Prunus armeniaca TaxID=36596 RepID=A0A6J5WJV0_PRUAR|nr:unnamed protein product [Prunus armeniaca]